MKTLAGRYILPDAPAWVDACSPNPSDISFCSANSAAAILEAQTFFLPDLPINQTFDSQQEFPILVQLPRLKCDNGASPALIFLAIPL
jgi:hypothetical protein